MSSTPTKQAQTSLYRIQRALIESRFRTLNYKNRMRGVYSFYKKNDIVLLSLPKNETKPKPLLKHKDIPTKEVIQIVLKHALERAFVLIGVSSGLGAQDISILTVGDFKKGYHPGTEVTTLKLRREKVGYDYITGSTYQRKKCIQLKVRRSHLI